MMGVYFLGGPVTESTHICFTSSCRVSNYVVREVKVVVVRGFFSRVCVCQSCRIPTNYIVKAETGRVRLTPAVPANVS